MFFDDCTVGSDTLDTVKENDIEVAKVLDEEGDLPEALLPERGTHRKASPEVCLVEPGLEQSQEGCVEEESCSSCNFPLVEQEAHLETNQRKSSAGFEEKMPPLGVNVEDSGDEDDVQHFSLDELAVADVPQESFPAVRPIDSSERDIEEKQVDEYIHCCGSRNRMPPRQWHPTYSCPKTVIPLIYI